MGTLIRKGSVVVQQAGLASELQAMLKDGANPGAMGLWLARNGEAVVEALNLAEDVVLIPEVDLYDPATIKRLIGERA